MYYKGRWVIPKTSTLISTIIREFQSSPMDGHSRELKTYQWIATELLWEGMRKDISKFVHECVPCQQYKYVATMPAGLPQPIPLSGKGVG